MARLMTIDLDDLVDVLTEMLSTDPGLRRKVADLVADHLPDTAVVNAQIADLNARVNKALSEIEAAVVVDWLSQNPNVN
jgi:hypothetical protein